jgi:eukaryotic-like serine/threonine-protein kinase
MLLMENASDPAEILKLLEPGALLGGPLFRSFLTKTEAHYQLPIGTRLGPFALKAEIARGGMGVVYLAERVEGGFDQQVAIKCMQVGESASAQVARSAIAQASAQVARSAIAQANVLELFRRERQILAQIRHPNIARFLDGGQLDDDQLWFAMEYIEGARIDLHATHAKLSIAERIALLRQVNGAVAFAHQRMLLHRDIKPGNVLIDSDGSVKLLDFGIAAIVNDDRAARAYSPAWASPEQQAATEVGPASDQYQLGRLLATLLDDQKPVSSTTLDGTLDKNPSWPIPAIKRAELRAILQRSTAANAADRYGSVVEFDNDLSRWLVNKPVTAHGHGIGYALACAMRRHVWLTALLFTTALGFVALVTGFSWRLAQERDLARAEANRANREAQTAAAISRFLQEDVLALADPNISQDVDLKVQTLLERAALSIDQRLAKQPLIAMQMHTTLARSLRGLGAFDAAKAQFALAQKLAESTLPTNAPPRLEIALWQADLALATSQPALAIQYLQPIIDQTSLLENDHRRLTLEAAVRTQTARFELGQEQPAIDALNVLLPRLDLALGQDSPLSIYALNRLAIMYNSVERLADSERMRAEHLSRATRAYGAEHSTTLTGRLNRAVLLRKLGRKEEAMSEALAAEAGLRKVFGFPSIAVLHAMNVRSRILESTNLADAIVLQRETLAGRIALLGPSHDEVAFSYVNLGGMLAQAKDYDAAVAAFTQALQIRQRLLPAQHVDVIINLVLLADTQRLNGQLAQAASNGAEALSRARKSLKKDRPELGSALFRYAQIQQALKQYDQASALATEAIAVYQHSLPANHPKMVELRAIAGQGGD